MSLDDWLAVNSVGCVLNLFLDFHVSFAKYLNIYISEDLTRLEQKACWVCLWCFCYFLEVNLID